MSNGGVGGWDHMLNPWLNLPGVTDHCGPKATFAIVGR